jgi:hypothetical protein
MRGGGAPDGAKVVFIAIRSAVGDEAATAQRPQARHRDVLQTSGPFFRVKARAPHSVDPGDFAPFTNTASSQHEWQSPIVGPDGSPRPPECAGYVTPRPQAPHPGSAARRLMKRPSRTGQDLDYNLMGKLSIRDVEIFDPAGATGPRSCVRINKGTLKLPCHCENCPCRHAPATCRIMSSAPRFRSSVPRLPCLRCI